MPSGSSDTLYATEADLAKWVGATNDLTSNSEALRQLHRASELLDENLAGAIYATDTNFLPTDAAIIVALRDATCAQVEWWMQTGDELEEWGTYHDVSVGDAGVAAKRVPGRRPRLAARAYQILHQAGLLPVKPLAGF